MSVAAEFANWLEDKQRLLVVAHQRPDGDAIGSVLGLHHCLRAMGKDSVPFADATLPARYRPYEDPALVVGLPMDLDFDGLICLDCANVTRLALPNGYTLDDFDIPIANLDHHIDNTRYGDFIHVDHQQAATATLLADIIRENSWPLPAAGATVLYLGAITDTGGFRFSNTSSATLRTAAWLLEQEADLERVMNDIFFNDPLPVLRLEGRVIEETQLAHDGRLAFFFLEDELLDEYGVNIRDTEDLIDVARRVAGATIICRMNASGTGVRFSLRSKDAACPVIGIAHEIGGGGHQMAAGAFRDNITREEAERLLIDLAGKVLNEQPTS